MLFYGIVQVMRTDNWFSGIHRENPIVNSVSDDGDSCAKAGVEKKNVVLRNYTSRLKRQATSWFSGIIQVPRIWLPACSSPELYKYPESPRQLVVLRNCTSTLNSAASMWFYGIVQVTNIVIESNRKRSHCYRQKTRI